jgi:voltage-gated potassium channel
LTHKDAIRRIIDDTDHLSGKVFAFTIQTLIVVSLATFSFGTLPDLSSKTKEILYVIEVITVTIFTLEYILRIIVAEEKKRFIFSFYGLVDLAAILPFYISSGLDLRAVRVFRLLRLVRILKLFKYSKAINRFHRALVIAKEELILFGFVAVIMLYLSAVGIYYFENSAHPEQFKSVFHSLWWAVTTLTTVGYGDMFPITTGGKLFTFFVLMIGLGIVAVPTGLVASALSQAREEDET